MTESTVPTPNPTLPPAPEPSTLNHVPEISLGRLDSLLEAYLDLLDEYTALRTNLSKELSDGFYSLARANHTSAGLGGGRRYGEEGYDERMKAVRAIVYTVEGLGSSGGGNGAKTEETGHPSQEKKGGQTTPRTGYRISIQKTRNVAHRPHPSRGTSEQSEDAEELEYSSVAQSAGTPAPSQSLTKPTCPENNVRAKAVPSNPDPLNWYGILVPQPLRQAQASFVSAVENSIPKLLNTSALMDDLETQIASLRIELGLRPSNMADKQARERDDSFRGLAASEPTEGSAHIPTSLQRRRVQRPPEPRSRILKLDG